MIADRYTIISADGHAGADRADYRPYLEQRWHGEFDTWNETFESPFGDLDRPDADRNWDSARRQRELENDGIVAEVLFPNTVPPFFPSGSLVARPPETAVELEQRTAGLRAHNRWLADFCAELPGRRAGLAQVFPNDPEEAARDIAWAAENGLAGVLVPAIPPDAGLIGLWSDRYDPIWAASQEHDLAVCQHGGAGVPVLEDAPAFVFLMEVPYFANRSLWHIIGGGVFERFPRLRFTMTEQKVGWVPAVLDRMDAFWHSWTKTGAVGLIAADSDQLPHPPSYYFHRNVWMGSSFTSPPEAETIAALGPNRVMWGGDFPHDEGTYPHTTEALQHAFNTWDPNTMTDLLGRTAATVYGLDHEHLTTLGIGPSIEAVASPLDTIPSSTSLAFRAR